MAHVEATTSESTCQRFEIEVTTNGWQQVHRIHTLESIAGYNSIDIAHANIVSMCAYMMLN